MRKRPGQRRNPLARLVRPDVDAAMDAQRRKRAPVAAAADVDRVIGRLAGTQGGIVGRGQLIGLGVSHGAIDHRVSTGRLIVRFRGVYAVGHGAIGDLGRAHAALIAAGPTAVLSHMTAAAWLRLVRAMPEIVEVTVLGNARRSRPGLVIHETLRVPEVVTIDSLPVTAPLRTLVDLSATCPAADVERACNEALVLKLVTEQQLEHARLVAPASAAPTRSRLERTFLAVVRAAGLPRPRVNHPVAPYLCDFVWPEHRVVVETDGWGSHGNRFAFERDKARDADLVARGWTVLRFTWRQIRDEPVLVIARLAQTLARREPGRPG
jgi:very-short-patch-repair endonuclease